MNRKANGRGLYFERMFSFGRGPCDGNQLEWILSQSSRKGVRRSMLQATILDPGLDQLKAAPARIPLLAAGEFRANYCRSEKHQNHLLLLESMMADRLAKTPTMQDGLETLPANPTIGNFLAYQFITDINYSELTDFSEMDFVVPGPGARDGLRKCFVDPGGLNEPELIRLMADLQEQEFERLGLKFQSLWGRRLQLIDCQNLFCEVDKNARVAQPNDCIR